MQAAAGSGAPHRQPACAEAAQQRRLRHAHQQRDGQRRRHSGAQRCMLAAVRAQLIIDCKARQKDSWSVGLGALTNAALTGHSPCQLCSPHAGPPSRAAEAAYKFT